MSNPVMPRSQRLILLRQRFNHLRQQEISRPAEINGTAVNGNHSITRIARTLIKKEKDKVDSPEVTREAREEVAQVLKDAMIDGQIPGNNHGEPSGPIKQRLGDEKSRIGGIRRPIPHDKRAGFRIVMRLEFLTVKCAEQVYRHTGNTMLNCGIDQKLGQSGLLHLLHRLNPVLDRRNVNHSEEVQKAVDVLRDNAPIFAAALYDSHTPTPAGLVKELRLKEHLAEQFKDGDRGLFELIERLTRNNRYPGWLPLSYNWREVKRLGLKYRNRLTAEIVLKEIGRSLDSWSGKARARNNSHDEAPVPQSPKKGLSAAKT